MLCDLHKVGDPLEAPAHHHLDVSLVQEDRLQVEQVPITEHTLPDLPKHVQQKVQQLGAGVYHRDPEMIRLFSLYTLCPIYSLVN